MAALADLLTSSAARQTLAQHDIAKIYCILRDAGVSQAGIALAAGQKQSEVSQIISGRQVQSVVLLERIADGLGVPRGWMGLAYAPGAAPVTQEVPQTEDLSNDNLLRHGSTVLRGRPVFGAADPIRVRDTPTPLPRRVGPTDIVLLTATTARLGQLLGEFGGVPVATALIAHARAGEALLGAAMREPVKKQLLVALSDAHRSAGCAAASVGLRELARQHQLRGMDCAGEAGEMLRAVLALNFLGGLEVNIGQPNEALKLFQLGAASARSALARSLFEYDCAWALGLLLRSGECGSGLHTAQQVIRLAKGLRSMSAWDCLAALQEAAAARHDSACQDLAREVAILRSAA